MPSTVPLANLCDSHDPRPGPRIAGATAGLAHTGGAGPHEARAEQTGADRLAERGHVRLVALPQRLAVAVRTYGAREDRGLAQVPDAGHQRDQHRHAPALDAPGVDPRGRGEAVRIRLRVHLPADTDEDALRMRRMLPAVNVPRRRLLIRSHPVGPALPPGNVCGDAAGAHGGRLELTFGGVYRVFADFTPTGGEGTTLGVDLPTALLARK